MNTLSEIPYGYCHCGCGNKTTISPHTSVKHGRTKGQPTKYLAGHGWRPPKAVKVPKVRPTDEERFWSNVERGNADACWEWTGTRQFGYGVTHFHGKNVKTHRVSYELLVGHIPKGLFALHKCDNRPCVNPAHIFIGTKGDNARDMVSKGRSLLGERNHKAKLVPADVREIRRLYATGEFSQQAIADKYGVTQAHVSIIIKRKEWKHIA